MVTTDHSHTEADTARPYRAGDPMPDLTVVQADGQPRALGTLWRDQPLVLVFLRQLGCIFCREGVARFVAIQPTLLALGARAGVVTLGTPEQASAFCRQRAPGLLCLADPEGDLYRQFDLGRVSLGNAARPSLWLAGMRATLAGHAQGRSIGDTGWMPGAFVVDTHGRIAYAHYATHAGDHAPEAEIIATVRALSGNHAPPP